jgi:hypothetical protein
MLRAAFANRRLFIKLLSAGALGPFAKAGTTTAESESSRTDKCFQLRATAAATHKSERAGLQVPNGDESRYPGGVANFSKSLPHNSFGEPIPRHYVSFIKALSKGSFAEMESVPLAGSLKLSNPLACDAFDMEGPDAHQTGLPAPPACSSDEQAAELVELYWQALTRDVPFER